MPERHAPEHQEDDRGDDEDVEEEVEEEGIHEWRDDCVSGGGWQPLVAGGGRNMSPEEYK